jgi:hypothetical protein
VGFDFSAEAIEIARERAAKAGMRFSFVHAISHALVLQGPRAAQGRYDV